MVYNTVKDWFCAEHDFRTAIAGINQLSQNNVFKTVLQIKWEVVNF